MVGCLIAALTYFPLFKALTHNVNPALEHYAAKTPISVAATDCKMHIFPTPKTGLLRLRQGEGLPDQGRTLVHVAAGRRAASRS